MTLIDKCLSHALYLLSKQLSKNHYDVDVTLRNLLADIQNGELAKETDIAMYKSKVWAEVTKAAKALEACSTTQREGIDWLIAIQNDSQSKN